MSKRTHPSHSEYQEQIMMGKAACEGCVRQIKIVQQFIDEGIERIPEHSKKIYLERFHKLTEDEKKQIEK